MKSAAVILLLGVFVCGVVCDPVANDGKQQTAETEYYPGPGRPRDNDDEGRGRRGDGDYGYNRRGDDGYRHDGGYKHHDSFFPEHPARSPLCACSRDLDKRTLSDKNGCVPTGCTGPSGYCTGTTTISITTTECPCATPANYGSLATFGSCVGTYPGTGGALCIEATCPNDGSIRIQGQAVPKGGACNLGCPAAQDFLYVYRGDLATGTPLLTPNPQDVDTTVSCTKGEVFQICEKNGVMVTSSVKFTYTGQTTGACNMLGAGDNWFSLGCTP